MANQLIPTLSDQLLGNHPTLVYHVEFVNGGPVVMPNLIGAGPLVCSASPDPPGLVEEIYPPRGELARLTTNGLNLQVTKQDRGPLSTTSVLMCGITSPPVDLSVFTMTADFLLPVGNSLGPTAPGDLWAATLVARDSQPIPNPIGPRAHFGPPLAVDPTDAPAYDTLALDSDFGDTHVGATHQVVGGVPPAIELGAGKTSPVTPDAEPKLNVYPPGGTSGFTLQTDIDCNAGRGWSRMNAGTTKWSERSWPYPLVPPKRPWAMIGVGLALAKGFGTVRVTVLRFSIYAWNGAIPK